LHRDTEESAPAEYPPEQPEADVVDDDGTAYGAEEEELEEEEPKDEVEAEVKTNGAEDHAMGGAEDTAGPSNGDPVKEDDDASDAGSEDLEAESSGSEEEDLDEEEGEGEGDGDEDMEMGEDGEHKAGKGVAPKEHPLGQPRTGEVMVH